MEKNNQPQISPFRQKIFDLMKQQDQIKILKLSRKFQNKNNTSHSPFKQFSMETDRMDDSKLVGLDTSSGLYHFKSLQEKLGLQNAGQNSRSKDKLKVSNEREKQKQNARKTSKQKKVSFIEDQHQSYHNPFKKSSKSKSKSKKSSKQSLNKSSSTHNSKQRSIEKSKSRKKLFSTTQNKSYNSSSKNITLPESSYNNYDSNDRQTQKKNYLLQTLKKMQYVRKNLSKTFQQYDQFTTKTQRSNEDSDKRIKSKQKTKSNLTVISDYVEEQSKSKPKIKKSSSKFKSEKSKQKLKNSKESEQKQIFKSPSIFHKKTPTKNSKVLKTNQPLSGSFSSKKIVSKQLFQKQVHKQLINSCKNPQKWQTLLQNNLISVHFRIVKKKLIEIQIHAQEKLTKLQVELFKQNFICQSINEEYQKVRRKQIITLLCSVRGLQTQNQNINLFNLPKLLISIQSNLDQNVIVFKKSIDLPYSWIMLIQPEQRQKFHSSQKKYNIQQQVSNRIKTRSTLQGLSWRKQLRIPRVVEVFTSILSVESNQSGKKNSTKQNKSSSKPIFSHSSQQRQIFSFELQDHEYKLFITLNLNKQKYRTYDLQIQGKGEDLMAKILMFLQILG